MPFTLEKFIDSKHLIIPLSSYNRNFEWLKTIKYLEKKYTFSKMWIQDPTNAYWQGKYDNVPGYGPHALAEFVNNKILESGATKILIIGVSMGGYGAILLGCLCNVDVVLAISPQTQILEYRKQKYHLKEKWQGLNINIEELDLKNVLTKYDTRKTIYKIFYGDKNTYDSNYAKRMSDFSNVKLFPVDSRKHTIARFLIDNGTLQKHLKSFLEN